jgi:hypothetical protein
MLKHLRLPFFINPKRILTILNYATGRNGVVRDTLKFLKFMIVNKNRHRNRSLQISLQTLRISTGQKTFDMSNDMSNIT